MVRYHNIMHYPKLTKSKWLTDITESTKKLYDGHMIRTESFRQKTTHRDHRRMIYVRLDCLLKFIYLFKGTFTNFLKKYISDARWTKAQVHSLCWIWKQNRAGRWPNSWYTPVGRTFCNGAICSRSRVFWAVSGSKMR